MDIQEIVSKYDLPEKDELRELLFEVITTLNSEPVELRPPDSTDSPGGLVQPSEFLSSARASIIVPDLHARVDFFTQIFDFILPDDVTGKKNITVKEALADKKIFVICVGDGFHGERRALLRWLEAEYEWLTGNILSDAMCREMRENLALMKLVMKAKKDYPHCFHFLKGNHENILNGFVKGNYPFRKFVSEGEMVKNFMQAVYGKKLIYEYADFEYKLPLFVQGSNFLVSHAEPAIPFSKKELINGLLDDEIVRGLTWTNNGEAQEDSVRIMLNNLLPDVSEKIYFAGHRAADGAYRLSRNGQFIQIHNPEKHFISLVRHDKAFNPQADMYNTGLAVKKKTAG